MQAIAPKLVLCYARHGQWVAAPTTEEEEDRDMGPQSEYYLAGLMIDRTFYGNPIMLRGYLPPKDSEHRLLDLIAQWAPEHLEAVQSAPEAVGCFVVRHWMVMDGEDAVRYLEVEEDVDAAEDLVGSWMLPLVLPDVD